MITLFFATAGGALGGSVLGPIGRFLGTEAGMFLGSKLDNALFGLNRSVSTAHSSKLRELNIQTVTYGKVIPLIYGNAKIAGNIIWAMPLKEVNEKATANIGRFRENETKYVTYATFAVAICKGVATELINIYANDHPVDKFSTKYRFYRGTEDQEPDPLISNIEGVTPAYRGLVYIVIEDFQLSKYGNKIPNFTFEISCNMNLEIARKIKAVNIIPGSGEFVYDTEIQSKSIGHYIDNNWVSSGKTKTINQNSNQNLSDALVSLDNMKVTLPNLEFVSVVINWFCNDLDIAKCDIYPAVEYQDTAKSIPEDWKVAGIKRNDARLISYDSKGRALYGGTINDNALTKYLKELKKRGYKILIYPILLMEVDGKPWRGEMTGHPRDVPDFFRKYEKFITHYANLTKQFADGFIIGSEYKGITRINHNGDYLGVTAFIKLAKSIKKIMNSNTIITYAANWDEYHSHNGKYNMDQLWCSPDIDVIGIDAYFPLTDKTQPPLGFSNHDIKNGWISGEGWDYYYQDSEHHTGKTKFSDSKWAWKNIKEWWSGIHIDDDGSETGWKPKMKKIWFVEYGFPSVDGCSNKPNVFVDNSTKESKFPFFSKGNIDFRAQAIAIKGTIDEWENSEMVENMFLWAWDARPFPYFPNLSDVWSDCDSWKFGHNIQGKILLPRLNDIISDILQNVGYKRSDFDCDQLNNLVEGFIINERYTARSAIEILQQAYFFDIVANEKHLVFKPQVNQIKFDLKEDHLVPIKNISFSITKDIGLDTPNRVEVVYIDRMRNYELSSTYSELQTKNKNTKTLFLPIILHNFDAQSLAYATLAYIWEARTQYSLNLPIHFIKLSPCDVIKITLAHKEHVIKITNIDFGNVLIVNGVAYNNLFIDFKD